jgi:hypothetical protein
LAAKADLFSFSGASMPITNDQLQAIQARVAKLVADKTDADAKTQISNQADTASAQASATAAQAKLDEASADALATSDLTDLSSYLDSLVAAPPVVPAPV